MFVIGTAGHVDHGKSALVQALTGIDPDRLQEEKARGMTIDLGFAWLKLPGGEEVSIVDVPGHERFIKNMLAGVGGIDLALLVVAADEGVMPQTREHLAILDLLGVQRAVLVVTKSDLVDRDWLDLVAAELEEVVSTTTLAGAPVVACSAMTREGLPELLAAIERLLAETPPKRDLGRPRLPIDRVFTVAGFGAVVTGTLIDGSFSLGQAVEVLPAVEGGNLTTLRARIRGLQTHRSKVLDASPGSRTAANLAGVETEELRRGQVVTTPGWLQPSRAVDLRLRALASLKRPLKHNLHITFHAHAAEAAGRLRLLEDDELLPGGEAWAQVLLSEPLALVRGDRVIIRDANETLGGGTIVATQARRHPRRRENLIAGLARLSTADPAETLYAAIAAREPVEAEAAFRATDLSDEQARDALDSLRRDGRIISMGLSDGAGPFYTQPGFEKVRRSALDATDAFLREHPLRSGILKEELRSRGGLAQRVFVLVLNALVKAGDLEDRGLTMAPPGWQPRLSAAQQHAAESYLSLLCGAPYAPPLDQRPEEAVVAYLVDQGRAVDAGDGVVFAREAFDAAVRMVVDHLQSHGTVTLAAVRDLLGTSRRYAQALLDHMDSRRITVRRGDERVLRAG